MRIRIGVIILAVMHLAHAQTSLRLHHSEVSYRLVELPVNSVSISRFEVDAPTELTALRIGFVNDATKTGKADILIYQDEVAAIPLLLNTRVHMRVDIEPTHDVTTTVRFPRPIHFDPSSIILVAIVPRTESLSVRMDEGPQQFLRTSPEKISTSILAFFDKGKYTFNSGFIDGSPIGNWHVELLAQKAIVSATKAQPRKITPRTFAQSGSSDPSQPKNSSGLRIAFSIPEQSTVRVEIKTLSGEFLRTLLPDTLLLAGLHLVEWDKKDQTGTRMETGPYELHVYSNERIALRQRIVLE